jgi:hypothetical protein
MSFVDLIDYRLSMAVDVRSHKRPSRCHQNWASSHRHEATLPCMGWLIKSYKDMSWCWRSASQPKDEGFRRCAFDHSEQVVSPPAFVPFEFSLIELSFTQLRSRSPHLSPSSLGYWCIPTQMLTSLIRSCPVMVVGRLNLVLGLLLCQPRALRYP